MTVVQPAAVPPEACRDPDDTPVLGTAVAGECQCIITGDDDLLTLGRFRGIDIIPPRDFWRYEAAHGG
jgi:predicted nucleic acid-binding protein